MSDEKIRAYGEAKAEPEHLSACPFCGSTKITVEWDTCSPLVENDTTRRWFAECAQCSCQGPFCQKEPQVMRAWNKRTLPSDVVSKQIQEQLLIEHQAREKAELEVKRLQGFMERTMSEEHHKGVSCERCGNWASVCKCDKSGQQTWTVGEFMEWWNGCGWSKTHPEANDFIQRWVVERWGSMTERAIYERLCDANDAALIQIGKLTIENKKLREQIEYWGCGRPEIKDTAQLNTHEN